VGTVGYDVFRSEAGIEEWTKANTTLIPAIGEGPGGRYQFVDRDAPVEGVVTYKIREVDAWGQELESKPVAVKLRDVSERAPRDAVTRQLRQPSARMVTNLENSARRHGRTKSGSTVRRVPGDSPTRAERPAVVKVGVAETGLYRISATEIAAALDESVASVETRIGQHKLALSTGGQPVGWLAETDARGLRFFGQAPKSAFAGERIYMLTKGRGVAIEMADATPPPPVSTDGFFIDRISFEDDLLMRPFNVVDEADDFWFWDLVLADDPAYGERTFEFELDDVAPYDAASGLTINVVGFAPGTRIRAAVFLNDAYVGDIVGPIMIGTETSFDLAQSDLVNGINTLKVVGRMGGMLIDRFEVTYGRGLRAANDRLAVHDHGGGVVSVAGFSNFAVDVFDVSDPLRPTLVPSNKTVAADGQSVVASFQQPTPGGTYFAVGNGTDRSPESLRARAKSDLRSGFAGAEHVIVTTSDLAGAAERLADHRRKNGLESMVVDIEDIFDDFAFGERDPGAVREFLTFAVDNWAVAPKYVVLAGRGHYDYRDLMGFGGNLVPPMLFATTRGLVPSDNLMADTDGDGAPNLAIGRLPVLSADELNAAVDKIIAYESEAPASWSRRVMLAADDADNAGEFGLSTDKMASAAPEDRVIEKAYLFDPYTPADMSNSLLSALDDGIEVVNWTGHAGLDSLADERVLVISDLDQLEGTPHPPVFVGLTCLLNNFGFQWFATLGEELAVLPGGGAIAVWSAAGLSNNDHAEELGESFFAALGGEEPRRLGDIIQTAIAGYIGPYSDNDLVNEYVLFGDPGLEMK
jgi:hypothetical protein